MKVIAKFKNRYTILISFIFIAFIAMFLKLANLTLVQGEEYKEKADSMRVQELPIRPARGEIRDRYGRLLAGNKPTFTVQIIKDQVDKKQRNKTALNLLRILDDEGEQYVNEFPIVLNVITYAEPNLDDSDIYEEIADIIIQNNLLGELLNKYNKNVNSDGEHIFYAAKRAILEIEEKNEEAPLICYLDDFNNVKIEFDSDKNISEWKKSHNIPNNLNAKESIVYFLKNNEKKVRYMIKHPIMSKMVYEILMQKGLDTNYVFNDFQLTYDNEYKDIKKGLMKQFSGITMNTTAVSDFVYIAIESGVMKNVLGRVIGSEENSEFIPAKLLFDLLNQNSTNMPIMYEIENDKVVFKYTNNNDKINFLSKYGFESEMEPIDALIYLALKTQYIVENDKTDVVTRTSCMESFVTNDSIKYLLQKEILNKGINPKISIAKWDYVPLINKAQWLEQYKSIGINRNSSEKEVFEKLREKYDIDEDLSDYEARYIMSIIQQLNRKVYTAYQPVNIANGIKDSTFARIMENNFELPGVKVSIDPTRYYPMGKTAAHLLGYLGKIAQTSEIEKYINELKYFPDDIIGKTGIEQKYEQLFKGENGYKKVEVDVGGNTLKVLEEKEAVPGNNLFLTIDAKLQKVAEASLKQALEQIQIAGEYKSKWGNYNYKPEKKDGRKLVNATSGAVVAIDVKTGEVLALANYPSYDPNLFVTGISNEDWESLKPENEEDPLAPRPLYNIALQTAIQPGSVFKMITGLAVLEKGMDPYKKINALGYVELGNQKFGCWTWNSSRRIHGPTDLFKAIKDSCNYYFYTLAAGKNLRTNKKIGTKIELKDILDVAKQFGLNDKTGIEIDIPAERNVGVPDPFTKINNTKKALRKYLNNNLKYYKKDDVVIDDISYVEIIEEIVSWVDSEFPLTRGEVYSRLSNFGFIPDKKVEGIKINLVDMIKYTYLNQSSWKLGDTFNIAIGQGQNSYTPIQIANYIATLANGGYKHDVSVVKRIEDINGEEISKDEKTAKKVELKDDRYLDYVKKGMNMAATEGTARSLFRNFPVQVGVKTGTAEKDGFNPATGKKYDDYSWFVAFAPYDDPQIAVATVIFQGGHGGFSGPIAKDIIAQYLGLNNKEDSISLRTRLAE